MTQLTTTTSKTTALILATDGAVCNHDYAITAGKHFPIPSI